MKTNKRFLALCLALLLACAVLPAPTVQGADVQPVLSAALAQQAAAALAAAFADKRISGLISELGGVFGMVLGVVGASALMLFISIISVTKAVSG